MSVGTLKLSFHSYLPLLWVLVPEPTPAPTTTTTTLPPTEAPPPPPPTAAPPPPTADPPPPTAAPPPPTAAPPPPTSAPSPTQVPPSTQIKQEPSPSAPEEVSTSKPDTLTPTTFPPLPQHTTDITLEDITKPTPRVFTMPTPAPTADSRNSTQAPPISPPPLVDFLRTAPPLIDSQVEDMDARPSAIVIGVTSVFLCIGFIILVCVLDSTSWYRDCKKLRRNLKAIGKDK